MQPHLQQSREQANAQEVVLLVQDTTDIDLSHRHKMSGVGQIGNERGRGFFVQTVLALRPQTREILGCMAQEPFVRTAAPQGEQRQQRRKREARETDVWMRQVQSIGTPDATSMWVHVGDRGADMFPFSQACQATHTHFLVRAAQNRRTQESEEEMAYSLTLARSWSAQASRSFEVPARHGHHKRSTQLQVAFGQITLSPQTITLGTFWTEVARLGGYLARRSDGPPGWHTIWKGWLFLQALLEGVHLAHHLLL